MKLGMKRAYISGVICYNLSKGADMKKKYETDRKIKVDTSGGRYTDNKRNRQQLTVTWKGNGKLKAVVIGINPSKANDDRSDRTLTLTARFLNMYGFTQFLMLNIFESYATNPKDIDLSSRTDFRKYQKELDEADKIFIAWGIEHKYMEQKAEILEVLKTYRDKLCCVENREGKKPLHPRRISYDYDLVRYEIT